jgi:hypothetical protein
MAKIPSHINFKVGRNVFLSEMKAELASLASKITTLKYKA